MIRWFGQDKEVQPLASDVCDRSDNPYKTDGGRNGDVGSSYTLSSDSLSAVQQVDGHKSG